jgi:hypothetical protein
MQLIFIASKLKGSDLKRDEVNWKIRMSGFSNIFRTHRRLIMTNPKIEKIDAAIAKMKAKISGDTAKLRELERQRLLLENNEIVSLFRRENLTDDDIAYLVRLKAGRETKTGAAEVLEASE